MNLEGKCCKPANETEYDLMKAVALAAGYSLYIEHIEGDDVEYVSYEKNVFYGVWRTFCGGVQHEQITLHDWVFKATHKDTGELVVPEWCNAVKVSPSGKIVFFGIEPKKGERVFAFELGKETFQLNRLHAWYRFETILTRQQEQKIVDSTGPDGGSLKPINEGVEPDQTWHERGKFPPVGTECEVSVYAKEFEWCKILFMGGTLCVVHHKGMHGEQHYKLNTVKFRPIPKKSPRDEWVENANSIAEKCNFSARDSVFIAIYDALVSGELEVPGGE